MTAAMLADATWPSIGARPTLLVPLGSLEQHGPHLPLDTDAVIATAVATGIAERLRAGEGSAPIVAPALAFGASGEHQSFPGTISIGQEALHLVLVELVRSAASWAGPIVIVNGHGGNCGALVPALAQLTAEGHRVRWIPCAAAGMDAHAGHSETSLMLHLAPDRVDMGQAAPGAIGTVEELMPTLRRSGVGAVSANGVLGDPTTADAATGAGLLAEMIANACVLIDSWELGLVH